MFLRKEGRKEGRNFCAEMTIQIVKAQTTKEELMATAISRVNTGDGFFTKIGRALDDTLDEKKDSTTPSLPYSCDSFSVCDHTRNVFLDLFSAHFELIRSALKLKPIQKSVLVFSEILSHARAITLAVKKYHMERALCRNQISDILGYKISDRANIVVKNGNLEIRTKNENDTNTHILVFTNTGMIFEADCHSECKPTQSFGAASPQFTHRGFIDPKKVLQAISANEKCPKSISITLDGNRKTQNKPNEVDYTNKAFAFAAEMRQIAVDEDGIFNRTTPKDVDKITTKYRPLIDQSKNIRQKNLYAQQMIKELMETHTGKNLHEMIGEKAQRLINLISNSGTL
jgi:hypothetical protein